MHAILKEDTIKRVCLWAGLAALGAGIGMAFEYGRAMSYLHAVSLSLLAIAGSVSFVGADIMRAKGKPITAAIVTVAGIGLLLGEYGTHFGYTVGSRVADTQQTTVTNAAYKAIQDNRANEQRNLDMWKQQLVDLEAERAAAKKANEWLPTVSAEGLTAEITTMEGDFVFKRSKQCADVTLPESRTFCDKRAALMKRLGAINEFNRKGEEIGKLTQRIDATQRILDKKTDTAVKTEFHSSKIVNQTAGFAQVATWSDEPSASALSWTQLVLGAIIAAITTYLAPFFFSIAFSDIRESARKVVSAVAPLAPDHPAMHTGFSTMAPALNGHSSITITDDRAVRDLMDRIMAARQTFARYDRT